MAPKPSTSGAFVKGIDASTGLLLQPRGSVPRGSNLILNRRGSLETCDGSAILAAYNAVPTLGRGPILCVYFFSPTGVPGYYLIIQRALDRPLGQVQNLIATDGGVGGTLPTSVHLFYSVTAADGSGHETLGSANEAGFVQGGTAHKVTLTWNIVPNAAYYTLYRGTTSGGEVLVTAPTRILQPLAGNLTVTVTDDGSWQPVSIAVLSTSTSQVLTDIQYLYKLAASHNLAPGNNVTVSGNSVSGYNQTGEVLSTPSSDSFILQPGGGTLLPPGTGGTVVGTHPPHTDLTQQIVLYKVPEIVGGVSNYNNSFLQALFPVNPAAAYGFGGTGGGSGSGSGGGTGSTITVTPTHISMTPGDVDSLAATLNGNTDVTTSSVWSSSNTGIATVNSSGNVSAVAVGNCEIGVTNSGLTAYCHVTVVRGA